MELRTCARPACAAPATATMTYEYATRTVWLDAPGQEPDPDAAWGLCAAHADRLRVPLGWDRNDRRPPTFPLRPPIAV